MILVLGKGISGEGAHFFLNHLKIEHDYLSLDEVIKTDYELIVKSPGISYENEYIKKCLKKNISIITDIELVSMLLNRTYIGITGTNGKTTTTSLIASGLKNHDAISCGNIGYSIGRAAVESKKHSLFVIEVSSFELAGIKNFKPHIAVIMNMAPAHMDYHKTIEEYYKTKMKITKNQDNKDYLVINFDDENIKKYLNTKAQIRTFSISNKEANCFIKNNYIYYHNKKQISIKKLNKASKTNYLAAYIVLRLSGENNRKIQRTFKMFKGVEYRLEAITNNIYNDAKSTNPSATINALKELEKEVVLICGGYNRGETLEELTPYLSQIKKVYAYGMSRNLIYKYMRSHNILVYKEENLRDFFPKVLNTKDTILYSPMFASYDQYNSFKERGKEFKNLVRQYIHCEKEKNQT